MSHADRTGRADSVDWAELASTLDGALLLPGDEQFVWARRYAISGAADLLPQAMARCTSTQDVAAALAFARERELPFALRGGAHSYADHSSTAGLLIDLSGLDGVEVDGSTVMVGAGATTGAVSDRLAAAHRLLPSGGCPTVGMAGLTVAGGWGFAGRAYGLTCDHLLAATIVLPDGRLTTVDEDHEPDLFWALRGAGAGNFGAVTSLTFRTHPAVPITTFHCVFDFADAVALIDQWQQSAPDAPDEISAELALSIPGAGEQPVLEALGVALTDRATTERLLIEILGPLVHRAVHGDVRQLDERTAARYLTGWLYRNNQDAWLPRAPFERPGFQFVKSEFFAEPIPTAAVELLVDRFVTNLAHHQHRDLEFAPWRGAYARVPADATAFVHRAERFLVRHTTFLPASADATRRRAARDWLASSWHTLHPHGSGRVYQGYPDPDLVDWADAYYGTNLPRLWQVKDTYDPHNVFTFAQALAPLPSS